MALAKRVTEESVNESLNFQLSSQKADSLPLRVLPLALEGELISLSLFHLFSRKKVSKKRRGDKFSGSPLAVGKTDAFALLLREKFSVS